MFKKFLKFNIILTITMCFGFNLASAEEISEEIPEESKSKITDMISEIFDKKEQYDDLVGEYEEDNCTSYGSINIDCSGITVAGYGTYSLEDYVAGVLGPEFGFLTDDEEVTKAYGMAIRTFAIRNTSKCKTTIAADTTAQVFRESEIQNYKAKANLSNGLVLTDGEDLFPASYALSRPYDCANGSSGDNCIIKRCHVFSANQDLSDCSSGYSTSTIPASILNWNGHTHFGGLEAYIAHYYATEKNYNAAQLINHFYGEKAQISSLNGSSSSGSSNSCSLGGAGYAEVNGIKFEVKNYNLEGTGNGLGPEFNLNASNVSQCPWYAKYRAIEIIMSSTLDDELKDNAKAVLLAANGNGNQWYGGTNNTLSYFKFSSDVTKPQPGAIVSWNRNSHNYGHVAIIEEVYSDGSVLISEGWNRFGADSGNSVSSIKIQTVKMTPEQLRTYNGTGSFIGYTYLFSYKN